QLAVGELAEQHPRAARQGLGVAAGGGRGDGVVGDAGVVHAPEELNAAAVAVRQPGGRGERGGRDVVVDDAAVGDLGGDLRVDVHAAGEGDDVGDRVGHRHGVVGDQRTRDLGSGDGVGDVDAAGVGEQVDAVGQPGREGGLVADDARVAHHER